MTPKDHNLTSPPTSWDMEEEIPDDFYTENERSGNDDAMLAECSPNIDGTDTGRSLDVDGTLLRRSMNSVRDFFLRLAQTKSATEQRVISLQIASQTPKATLYPSVAKWLNDRQNIIDATLGRYQSIDQLTDNVPQIICDKLNDLGLKPEDKTKWTPQNLMPVAFSVKMENTKQGYELRIHKLRKFSIWLCCLVVALIFVVLFMAGILGPQKPRPQIVAEGEPLNIDTIVKRYQDQYHYVFGDWRIGQIKDTGHITKENALQYLHKQRELQDKSIEKQRKNKQK